MKKVLSVTEFRKNLFTNIDYVYRSGNSLVVQKAGIPLVKITQINQSQDFTFKYNDDNKNSIPKSFNDSTNQINTKINNIHIDTKPDVYKSIKLNTDKILNDTKGIWKEDSDYEYKNKKREELEKKLIKQIKDLW